MSGSFGGVGGVDSAIPLSAGRIGQQGQGGNTLLSTPTGMIDALKGIETMQYLHNRNQLFPGEQTLQQQEIQKGGIGVQSDTLKLQQAKLGIANQAMSSLLGKGDAVKLSDVMNITGQLAANGMEVDPFLAGLKASGATDGASLAAFVRQSAGRSLPPGEAVTMGAPSYVGTVGLGQTAQPIAMGGPLSDQRGVVSPAGAALPVVPSTSDLATPVSYVGPNGRTVNTTKGQYAIDAGVNPATLGPVVAGQTMPSISPPARKDMSGPTPGQVEAGKATGTESAAVFHGISQAGDAARSQDALLSALEAEAKNFRPGPGADTAESVKRLIVGVGAQFGTNFGVDLDKLAAKESVDKIANQLANAAGAGSDARLHVNQGSNPSSHNTPAGLDMIIRQLRGTFDYAKVRQQLAAAYPDKADSQGFLANVASNLDPRVFQYNRLGPEQKVEYYKGITDKNAFKQAYGFAETNKYLPAMQ
jgi:hypothetical protein